MLCQQRQGLNVHPPGWVCADPVEIGTVVLNTWYYFLLHMLENDILLWWCCTLIYVKLPTGG